MKKIKVLKISKQKLFLMHVSANTWTSTDIFFFLSTFLPFFFLFQILCFYLKLLYICFEEKLSQLFDKKKVQLHTSNSFSAMTRKINKGVKFSVFFLLYVSCNILYLTYLLTYFHGSRTKFSHLAKS